MQIPEMCEIEWNGFMQNISEPSRANQESCAWIFVDIKNDRWYIYEVKNVGLKGRSIKDTFAPDRKEFFRVKQIARTTGLTKIGNVHTHVTKSLLDAEYQFQPSETDLKYARRYNDIIRAIVVTIFPDSDGRGYIYGIIWFDQYGKILKRERFL